MVCCIVCDGEVCLGFSYFCRACYREVAKQLPLNSIELKEYLENTFDKEVKIGNGWNFKLVRQSLLRRHQTLDKLAVLLGKVLFLKLASCRALEVKTTLANSSNDRICCSCGCRYRGEFDK